MLPEPEVTKSLIAALASPEYVLVAIVILGCGYLVSKFGNRIIEAWITQNNVLSNSATKIATDIAEFKETAKDIKDDIRELNSKIATVIAQVAVHETRISHLEVRK
jgi:prefoldin subunit 5